MPHNYLTKKQFTAALAHLITVVQNGIDGSSFIEAGVEYLFESDAGTGVLLVSSPLNEQVSVRRYLHPWLHVRFDDPKQADGKVYGPTLNPYSGKWNHHPYDAQEALQIESRLRGINMRVTGVRRGP